MSVFKPDDSPFFYASYRDEHGERVRVSTKKKTKREAMAVEAELRNRAERVRLGLEVRSKNVAGMTLADATLWWKKVHGNGLESIGKVWGSYKTHLVDGALGDRRLEDVTPAKISELLADIADEVSPATANHVRMYLSGVFTQLRQRGQWFGDNPVEFTAKVKGGRSKKRTLPPSYVQLLMTHAPTDEWLLMFTTAAYAGPRKSEIVAALRTRGWPAVDWDERTLALEKTKTGVPRVVGIHEVLLDVLRFCRRRGVFPPSSSALTKAHERVREALKRGGVVDNTATFHGLRGTWGTQMLTCGANHNVTRYMGWGPRPDEVMDANYILFRPEVLRREIDKLHYPIKESE